MGRIWWFGDLRISPGPDFPGTSSTNGDTWIYVNLLEDTSILIICHHYIPSMLHESKATAEFCPHQIIKNYPETIVIWLVVWNIWIIFPYIGKNDPNWRAYFSEGFVHHQPGKHLQESSWRKVSPMGFWWCFYQSSEIGAESAARYGWICRQDQVSSFGSSRMMIYTWWLIPVSKWDNNPSYKWDK